MQQQSTLMVGMCLLLLLSGCKKEQHAQDEPTEKKPPYELTLNIKNITKRTLYLTCFSYMKKDTVPRWRWYKTPVVVAPPQSHTVIPVAQFMRKKLMTSAYGTLGVFTQRAQAERAIYELLPDENKIDLDRLHKLNDKTVVLGIEKYGVVGDIFDYSFFPDEFNIPAQPELDFTVENRTGKTLYATAFIYQKNQDMPIWRYDKSPVIRIENGESALIDVDTLTNHYDRKYMRGYLAVFDKNEEEEAYQSTFQLLKPHQKVNVGLLSALRNRKIILKHQKYGILGDIVDFTVKKPRKIAFSKYDNIKNQPRYTG